MRVLRSRVYYKPKDEPEENIKLIEKIEELAVAADYIVSAEELGYMIEEIDLREEATVRTTQQQEELVDTEDLLIQL